MTTSGPHPSYDPYNQPDKTKLLHSETLDEVSRSKMPQIRKPITRRTVDYHSTVVNYLSTRPFFRSYQEFPKLTPSRNSLRNLKPIAVESNNPSNAYCTKYVSTSINKHKCAVNCLIWSPDGKRLITGNALGQFTLWNALKFNFDTILNAHDYSVRRMIWKYDTETLVSADSKGYLNYWTCHMKNLLHKSAHDDTINDLSFSPTYEKFASAGADEYVKIWDFARCEQEQSMKEHGWDVTSVDWHPVKSLVVSGSKDKQIKLWDPRTGDCIRSLHGHKNTVTCLGFNRINGNWLMSGSKDYLIKIFDLRTLKELQSIRGELDEISCLQWHPLYESLFVAGGSNGNIKYFLVGKEQQQAEIHKAHEQIVWAIAWHPLGHIIASASNDQTTRFWTRNRPGDEMNDQYNANQLSGKANRDAAFRTLAMATKFNPMGGGSHGAKQINEVGVNEEELINTAEEEDPFISGVFSYEHLPTNIPGAPVSVINQNTTNTNTNTNNNNNNNNIISSSGSNINTNINNNTNILNSIANNNPIINNNNILIGNINNIKNLNAMNNMNAINNLSNIDNMNINPRLNINTFGTQDRPLPLVQPTGMPPFPPPMSIQLPFPVNEMGFDTGTGVGLGLGVGGFGLPFNPYGEAARPMELFDARGMRRYDRDMHMNVGMGMGMGMGIEMGGEFMHHERALMLRDNGDQDRARERERDHRELTRRREEGVSRERGINTDNRESQRTSEGVKIERKSTEQRVSNKPPARKKKVDKHKSAVPGLRAIFGD